jgi:type VI secretion system protein ImpH
MTMEDNEKRLNAFWRDEDGNDRAHAFNFYRFCQLLEKQLSDLKPIGSTFSPKNDAVRFRPHPGMGFPVSELKAVETDPERPDAPPTVRTTFMGLYGVDSPLPTGYIDDIAQKREGHEAQEAFLDIFNHRMMTQFYRIWRKYSYPATFEDGGTDKTSRSLMALTGITDSNNVRASRLRALLHDTDCRRYCQRHYVSVSEYQSNRQTPPGSDNASAQKGQILVFGAAKVGGSSGSGQ